MDTFSPHFMYILTNVKDEQAFTKTFPFYYKHFHN